MKTILTTLLFASACFGQIELMQNNYPTNPGGLPPYPDATIALYACLTGSAAGVNNVPIILDWHQYIAWGYHSHEIGGVLRPEPTILGSLIQLTGHDGNPPGCVSWQVELNGFAGGYTFTASSPGFPVKGINYTPKQYNVVIGRPSYFPAYTSDVWPGSPLNQPASLHPDTRHTAGSSRYVSSDVYANFLDLSRYYKQLTVEQVGFADLLDITRISLPDGGIYDNDVNGITPGPDQAVGDWNTRVFEEHARGVEADIYVPAGTLRQDLAFASITTAGCYIGLYTPNGDPIGTTTQTENYWRSKFIMHVSCRPGRALKGGSPRAN